MGSRTRRLATPFSLLCLMLAAAGCRKSAGSQVVDESGAPNASAQTQSTHGPLVGNVLRPGHPGVVDVIFEVHADREAHAISPFIYGYNGPLEAKHQRWGVIRNGGNRATAYNWENNASNAGSDYLFQNDSLASVSDEPAKPLLENIDTASSIGAASIITISNADYVAADKLGGGDVRSSGPQYLATRFKRNHPKKPTAFADAPDARDDAVYQDEFVAFLKKRRASAKILFSMDNEPDLWTHTHAEIFTKPLTYEDLWKRNHDFAKATKEAWPGAEVLGFVSYGYAGFQNLQDAPDAAGRNFLDWYLDQAREAERKEGTRWIDYLDLHWYPEVYAGDQRIVSPSITPEVIIAREQAPRSLWDPKYKESSWICDKMGGPIDLIDWVRAKIDAHYPGTKLAFSEWNFGGGNHISGAIAVADVLGILGSKGVDLASYWPITQDESFALAAFRIFRNYDGQGAAFADTSVSAHSSDVRVATVYASIESRDPTRTVIVAINKANTKKKAGIQITHSAVFTGAKVYALSGVQPVIVAGPALSPVATNTFAYEMPAQSVSVILPAP